MLLFRKRFSPVLDCPLPPPGVAPTVQIYNALYMQLRVEGNEDEARVLLQVNPRSPCTDRLPICVPPTLVREMSGHGAH